MKKYLHIDYCIHLLYIYKTLLARELELSNSPFGAGVIDGGGEGRVVCLRCGVVVVSM